MKYIFEIILLIPYICSFGMITFKITFHDGSKFELHGWMA
jgi:hypothetical protein